VRARELLAQRRLGKILQVQASAVYSGPYRGWDPKSDWYFDPRSGGVLYDWGSHLVDLLFHLTGIDIEAVSAAGERSLPGLPLIDNIAAAFRATKGVVGTIDLAWGTRGNILMFQIHGTAGSLLVSPDYFEHRTPQGGGLNQVGTHLANARAIVAHKAGAVIRRKSSDDVHPQATDCFIQAICGNPQGRTYMWDAVRVHRVLEAVGASVTQGHTAQQVADRQIADRPPTADAPAGPVAA
jgi:predicted dehydrogenase